MTDVSVEEKQAQIRANMEAAGQSPEEKVQDDYFGFEESHQVTLPDGLSWVQFKVMSEGERRKYLNEQNRDVTIDRATGNAKLRTAPGDERYSLLKNTLVNWNLTHNGKPVPFSPQNLDRFLDKANPRVVDQIEKEVRKAHPWLMAEMTLEDIDKEIENLKEMRQVLVERESGNDF